MLKQRQNKWQGGRNARENDKEENKGKEHQNKCTEKDAEAVPKQKPHNKIPKKKHEPAYPVRATKMSDEVFI